MAVDETQKKQDQREKMLEDVLHAMHAFFVGKATLQVGGTNVRFRKDDNK